MKIATKKDLLVVLTRKEEEGGGKSIETPQTEPVTCEEVASGTNTRFEEKETGKAIFKLVNHTGLVKQTGLTKEEAVEKSELTGYKIVPE